MNTENNRNLSDEELNQVAGGAGDAMGKWLIGDYFTVKSGQGYYFGVLQDILTYFDGETRYIIESKFNAQLSAQKVYEYNWKVHVNPDDPSTGVVIKKI